MFLIGVEFSIPDMTRVQSVALVSDGGRKRIQHTDRRAVDFDIAKSFRRVQYVPVAGPEISCNERCPQRISGLTRGSCEEARHSAWARAFPVSFVGACAAPRKAI
jgi:hypothetical protein